MLQASSALNLTMYLLLKKEDQNSDQLDAESSLIQSHPVMARLQRLNSLSDKLEEYVENKVPGLSKQLANIAEAAKLVDANSEKEDSAESDDESVDQIITSDNEAELDTTKTADLIETASSDEDDQSVSTHESAKEERRVQTEARFGLRHSEISQSKVGHHRKRRAVDFGEIEAVDEGIQKAARQSLAATLNTIEQKTSRKNTSQLPDIIDETQEPDDALRRGLEMMEEQLGKDFDKNSDDASHQASFDPERDSDDEMGFYEQVAKKSKIAKAERKARYAVAPKFPRMDSVVEGERAISSHILKNRGLVAHKAKINRNPRVKKRVQYKKALVRRKGAVREVRQDEGHKYGGESTGIKTKVSRSRKLA
ncbi:U3 small nucleolar RNA-associated protein 3 [Fistulifera solaris]|uniref:U3 small nucleolar RNA-associated protein 3 n=1 Tax=Fistulifera solaris TaxID=1519565 RepID=A0A1Z5J7A3_FISSO|nr:U3 small nucleolar RNA-associated protein 3 [Fistulifera solaris]|eukprot:GAX09816.1 U3 small nucleolar RNA-associated protein 3 [Fistulifera solaris]